MTGTAIPKYVVQRAITNAQIDPLTEHIGFFFTFKGRLHVEPDHRGGPYVIYKAADNIAKDPRVGAEVAAEWMADQMLEQGLNPLAMFHSHPSQMDVPSEGDLEYFPVHYVNWSLIWVASHPKSLTMYNAHGEIRKPLMDGLVIPDAQ
jgi:proteasome lid subunit RPN8/RPN11